jgi:hypothetical protein
VNAGTPPEPGMSRMTIGTYRVGPDGERLGRTRRQTYRPVPDPERLVDSLSWPPCRCFRCRSGQVPHDR